MSLACCDLLGQLLTPEPDARITLSRVMRHPWFVRDAPPGLLELNSRLLRQDRSRHAVDSRQGLHQDWNEGQGRLRRWISVYEISNRGTGLNPSRSASKISVM